MKLKSLLEYDKAFEYVKWISLSSLLCSIVVVGISLYTIQKVTNQVHEYVYVSVDDQLIKAKRVKNEKEIESIAHIDRFHHLFFTLHPDKEQIKRNTQDALAMIDKSGYEAYNRLNEAGFYQNIISGNISVEIQKDSIYRMQNFHNILIFVGKQKIVRPSSITIRNLKTQTYLRPVEKTSINPFGLLMERWEILDNQDIETYAR